MITLTSITDGCYNMEIRTAGGAAFSVRLPCAELFDKVLCARDAIISDDALDRSAGIMGGLPAFSTAAPQLATIYKWSDAINNLFFAHSLGLQTFDFMYVDFFKITIGRSDITPICILERGDLVSKSIAILCNDPLNDGNDFLGFISGESVLSDVELEQSAIDAGEELPRPLIITPLTFLGQPRIIERGDLISNRDGAFVKMVTNINANTHGRICVAESSVINTRFLME